MFDSASKNKCFVIAEIAQAHDGSLGSALAYIDACAEAGADAIKFQVHLAEEESTIHDRFRTNGFPQDASRYDYWKRMEFTLDQWKLIAKRCKEKNIVFFATPFSTKAVYLLQELNVPFWKIGSGETSNNEILDAVIATKQPVLFSTGMSPWSEIEYLVCKLRNSGIDFGIFQCTTSYPVSAKEIGLNIITELKGRYSCPVGLSDHSGEIFSCLAAVALGADMLEVHVTFSKKSFGPDTLSSLTIEQLSELVKGVRFLSEAKENPVNKDRIAEEKNDLKLLFSRSAFYCEDMENGQIFNSESFKMKKPGGGMLLEEANRLIGKKLNKQVTKDDFIEASHFEA